MCFTIIHLKTYIDLSLIYPHFALQVHFMIWQSVVLLNKTITFVLCYSNSNKAIRRWQNQPLKPQCAWVRTCALHRTSNQDWKTQDNLKKQSECSMPEHCRMNSFIIRTISLIWKPSNHSLLKTLWSAIAACLDAIALHGYTFAMHYYANKRKGKKRKRYA